MTDSSTIHENVEQFENNVYKKRKLDDGDTIKRQEKKIINLKTEYNELAKQRLKQILKSSSEQIDVQKEKKTKFYEKFEGELIEAILDLKSFAMCKYGFMDATVVPRLDKIVKYFDQMSKKKIFGMKEDEEQSMTGIEQMHLWLMCLIVIDTLTKNLAWRFKEPKQYVSRHREILIDFCEKFKKFFENQQGSYFGSFEQELVETYIVNIFDICCSNIFNAEKQTLELLKQLVWKIE